jgi:hypothetical protein
MFHNDIFSVAASSAQGARRKTGAVPSGSFDMSTMSGAIAHFRSDRGLSVGGNNRVHAWQDYSSAGNHITQSIAAYQPVYKASDAYFNNKPTVEFFGMGCTFDADVELFLEGFAGFNASYVGGTLYTTGAINGSGSQTGYTYVGIYRPIRGYSAAGFFGIGADNSVNGYNSLTIGHGRHYGDDGWSNSTKVGAFMRATEKAFPDYDYAALYSSADVFVDDYEDGPAKTTARLIIFSHNSAEAASGSIKVWIDGDNSSMPVIETADPEYLDTSAVGSNWYWSGSLKLGAGWNKNPDVLQHASGSYAECCFFNRQLTVLELQQIQTYASQTYAISQSLITSI